MSGSGGSRSDWSDEGSSGGGASGSGGGGVGTSVADPCLKIRRGPINSPRAAVLAPLKIGDMLNVNVNVSGSRPVLEVLDVAGSLAGSLTFLGYHEVIDCMLSRDIKYRAVIIAISGGIHEVRVEPI